ncbi:MAG: hypothetical protein IJ381_02035 [Clostridia bacterium]|nr:hypothetical protein [Clostridia bacterium]
MIGQGRSIKILFVNPEENEGKLHENEHFLMKGCKKLRFLQTHSTWRQKDCKAGRKNLKSFKSQKMDADSGRQ